MLLVLDPSPRHGVESGNHKDRRPLPDQVGRDLGCIEVVTDRHPQHPSTDGERGPAPARDAVPEERHRMLFGKCSEDVLTVRCDDYRHVLKGVAAIFAYHRAKDHRAEGEREPIQRSQVSRSVGLLVFQEEQEETRHDQRNRPASKRRKRGSRDKAEPRA